MEAVEAERSVLGAILLDPGSIGKALDHISEDDFQSKKHRLLWASLLRLSDSNIPIDTLSLSRDLELSGSLEEAGGIDAITSLMLEVPHAANIVTHAKMVREQRLYRDLYAMALELSKNASQRERPAQELIEVIEQQLYNLAKGKAVAGFRPIRDILVQSLDRIQAMSRAGAEVTGIPTGFAELNRITAGWQNSDLIVIAARPSMGKTALAMQCAVAAAESTKKPVAVFSLEMDAEQLGTRMLCTEARIDSHAMRTNRLGHADWQRLAMRSGELEQMKLWINDSPSMTLSQLRSAARRFQAEHGLAMLVIDYLQLLPDPPGAESRQQGVSEISRSLKLLAKELHVPILALSQLNRAVEQRVDRHPVLADLRESGSIEQDADVVLFIYRDEFYNRETDKPGVAELLIRKHRNGPTADIELAFMSGYAKFGDLAL